MSLVDPRRDRKPVMGHRRGAVSIDGSPGASQVGLGGLGVLLLFVIFGAAAWRHVPGAGIGPSEPPPSTSAVQTSAEPLTAPPATSLPEASPVQGGPIVEVNIVDRPGVPASLYEKYWVGGGQVGQVGTTARMVVPEDEQLLGVDRGHVATFPIDPNTSRPVVGRNGMTILVRDIRTGAIERTIETPFQISYGLIVGSLLIWTGRTLPDSPTVMDAGLWVVDLDVPDAQPKALIQPSDLAESYGPDAVRGPARLTDEGRSVVTLIQSPTQRGTDIVDLGSLTLRRTLADSYALEVIDGISLVIPVHGDRGQSAREMRLVRVGTGATIGAVPTEEVAWAFAANGAFYVQHGFGGTGYRIDEIDAQTGNVRELLTEVALDLSHRLSAPDNLVLVAYDWEVGEQGKVLQPVTLLDPVTGILHLNAFTIGNP